MPFLMLPMKAWSWPVEVDKMDIMVGRPADVELASKLAGLVDEERYVLQDELSIIIHGHVLCREKKATALRTMLYIRSIYQLLARFLCTVISYVCSRIVGGKSTPFMLKLGM